MSETKQLRPFLVKALIQRARDHAIQDHCDEVSTVLLIDMANELSRRDDTELVEALREALFFAEVDLRASLTIVEAIKGEGTALGLRQTIERVEKANAILRKREGEA